MILCWDKDIFVVFLRITLLIGTPEHLALIITLEGTDQAGKKTQVAMLVRALRKAKLSTATFSFPAYTTPVGRLLKASLVGRRQIPPQTIHCLMSANRWEMLPKITAAIDSKSVIVMNRYYHSNVAYGVANGLGRKWLESLDAGLPKSDLVILLDSHSTESFRRKSRNRDAFERDADFQARALKEYRRMARRGRWGIVDATQDRRAVHEDILKIVARRLRV